MSKKCKYCEQLVHIKSLKMHEMTCLARLQKDYVNRFTLKEGDRCPRCSTVRGNFRKLPIDKDLWVCMYCGMVFMPKSILKKYKAEVGKVDWHIDAEKEIINIRNTQQREAARKKAESKKEAKANEAVGI